MSGARRVKRRGLIWVAAALAVVAAVAVGVRVSHRDSARPPTASGDSTSSLLALTWGPSLCAVDPRNSGCRSGHVGRLGPVFVLHGLWPQPSSEEYCGVADEQRTSKPPVPLPDDLRATLRNRMSDVTVMAPHEWYAHGSCSGVTPPEYFRLAADLTDQANAALDPLFGAARGREISGREVRQAFEGRFGAGAGRRVALTCRDGTRDASVLYEVRLSLPTVVELRRRPAPVSLGEALAAGPIIAPGCGRGTVP